MARFLVRRLVFFLFTLLIMSVIVFLLARLAGDPRSLLLSEYSTREDYEAIGRTLGLDRPLYHQYWVFLRNVVGGDMGQSIVEQRPVRQVIWERLPATVELGLGAFVLAMLVGIPLGILSAVKRGTAWDNGAKILSLLGLSLPTFWTGILLIYFFGVKLDALPVHGREEGVKSFVLPWVTLASFWLASNVRLLRTGMLEVMDSEYIKVARAKGLHEWAVIFRHALRNAFIAPLTYAGITLGTLLAGSIVVEQVFAWPGMGRLALDSIQRFDYPVVQGIVLTFTVIYLVSSFLVDVLYALIDPRIRHE